MLLIRSG